MRIRAGLGLVLALGLWQVSGTAWAASTPYWTNGVPLATPPLTGLERFPADTYAASGVQQESISVSQLVSSASSGLLSTANTWTALQTFQNSDIAMLGSSTGKTTWTSDNAGASNFTLHFPAANDTLVVMAEAQTLTNKTISGTSNTLSNIGNSSLVNSAITIAGVSTALGGSITGSTILDALGNVQGDVLYRGASGWTVLAPGATGQALTTGGASANPSWSTVATLTVGTWTPTLIGSTGGSATLTVAVGSYVQIGTWWQANAVVTASSVAGLTGNAQMGGLPWTQKNTANDFGQCSVTQYSNINGSSSTLVTGGQISPNASVATLVRTFDADGQPAAAAAVTTANLTSTSSFNISCSGHT